jgi:hypothetical protein
LICIFFISCDGELTVSTYIRDLQDISKGNEDIIYTTVNIVVEGLEDEEDIEFLRNNLNSFSNEKVIDYNYSTSLSFDIKVPIVKKESINLINKEKDLMIIIVENNQDVINAFCNYNNYLVSILDEYVYDKHWDSLDLNNFNICFNLHNDTRSNQVIETFSSYINSIPYPDKYKVNLADRDRLDIQISEVLRKAIVQGEKYCIFSIKNGT